MRIAHLTDPHLTALDGMSPLALKGKRRLGYLSWWYNRRHQHRVEMLARIDRALAADDPDVTVVTGDLVHLGLPSEISRAREWLERLGEVTRIVLVPGNHDCYREDSPDHVHEQWARFLRVQPNSRSGFPSVLLDGSVSFIGLSSALPVPVWSAGGEIGRSQLEKLDRILDETSGTFRCLGLHHPPLAGQVTWRKALADAPLLEGLIRKHGVELVLHGHVHCDRETIVEGRTRVMSSASASRVAGRNRATFRTFDVEARATQWQVTAKLKSVDDEGAAVVLSEQSWQVARIYHQPSTTAAE
jgi:3',5'-cyclic AMP phosphodiesterase CpdA